MNRIGRGDEVPDHFTHGDMPPMFTLYSGEPMSPACPTCGSPTVTRINEAPPADRGWLTMESVREDDGGLMNSIIEVFSYTLVIALLGSIVWAIIVGLIWLTRAVLG